MRAIPRPVANIVRVCVVITLGMAFLVVLDSMTQPRRPSSLDLSHAGRRETRLRPPRRETRVSMDDDLISWLTKDLIS
jgi:hypothetical protein